jgi:diacylglycerol kinase family enzyme
MPWGTPMPLPDDGVVVTSDAEASLVLEAARRGGREPPVVGLLGGDLCRTLGGLGDRDRLRGSEAVTFAIDAAEAVFDGEHHLFVAHLIAHDLLWRQVFAAMNAQWRGSLNIGPRAHPGDGLLDTYQADLHISDLVAVRSRIRHGAHLPHPRIRERRTAAKRVELDHTVRVELDGRRAGSARRISVTVLPEALRVVV